MLQCSSFVSISVPRGYLFYLTSSNTDWYVPSLLRSLVSYDEKCFQHIYLCVTEDPHHQNMRDQLTSISSHLHSNVTKTDTDILWKIVRICFEWCQMMSLQWHSVFHKLLYLTIHLKLAEFHHQHFDCDLNLNKTSPVLMMSLPQEDM